MYHRLFNEVTDALKLLDDVLVQLKAAQAETEELYISHEPVELEKTNGR